MSLIYDKLKDMQTEEKIFDFCCPNCKANGMKQKIFKIYPLDIAYRPDLVDNTDIKDADKKNNLNNLPILRKALEAASMDKFKLLFTCNSCNETFRPNERVKQTDIKKWCNRNLPFVLDLRKK